MDDVTRMLQAIDNDGYCSAHDLLPLVYEELRKLAAARMAAEPDGHTLAPTALVHEAWLRMVRETDRSWHNRAYFFTVASTAMRRILVDHARRKATVKHGGDMQRVNIDMADLAEEIPDDKTLVVDEALKRLEKVHPQWAQIMVMKYFGGMLNIEIAEALNVNERSVRRWSICAKTWLFKDIEKER
ncbi:MAG: sigma-70 family RNA polymerase sigma factor [Pontiellaceae bacterium]|nr:sigma-70 family RNA polymerase sigma factor [Pontiellaceae bacterium]MBN2784878.1 sigma-70 family RNA polymerase sigma factor [Pontiellaceae bacterium]